jgi:hypothetical protein
MFLSESHFCSYETREHCKKNDDFLKSFQPVDKVKPFRLFRRQGPESSSERGRWAYSKTHGTSSLTMRREIILRKNPFSLPIFPLP